MGYWMYETTGALRPAVEAYLTGSPMSPEHIALMREYLRQWMATPVWRGPAVPDLRRRLDDLTSSEAINAWLDDALDAGIDPL